MAAVGGASDVGASGERLLFLVGPTAVGKTAFALELAPLLGAWIVSMDSMQVYRRMDIGTAKPTSAERARVPHFVLDVVEPSERYDLQRYLADAEAARMRCRAAGRRALFVGGAGLYLKALSQGLFQGPPVDLALREVLKARARELGSPALHAELASRDAASAARIHPNDEKRVLRALEVLEQTGRSLSDWQREWGWHGSRSERRELAIVGLGLPEPELGQRVRARIARMLDEGWVEEARAIRDGAGFGPTAIQALGYRELLDLCDAGTPRAEIEERLVQRTRQFIRRQNTWFRSFAEIVWLDPRDPAAGERALQVLGRLSGS